MAFLVWGVLACSGVYWLIQLLGKPLPTPGQAVVAAERHGGRADLTRLFGAAAVAELEAVVVAESRFKLLGVVAPLGAAAQRAGEGVALIAVDGVARTVRVGARVDGDLHLLAVDARSASLGQGGVVSLTLQIASPSAATTGALTPALPSPMVLGGAIPAVNPVGPMPLPPQPLNNDPSALGQQAR